MTAEFLIVLVITLFVLMVRAKIKSKYDANAFRRDINRNYRLKRNVKVVFLNKEEKEG